ncbi:host attachment protein [Massilia cavernae]|nr:host attachment protein [Massilia cavernae]
MQTTWVIAADSSRARIFELEQDTSHLLEIEDMVNPEGRQTEREIEANQQHDVEMFSKQLGHYIDKACVEHRFDALTVIAPPKFLGLIRENLSDQSRRAVQEEIPKDIAWFEGHQIEEYLKARPH